MTLLAAMRDASFNRKPGKAVAYHVVAQSGLSCCGRLLNEGTVLPASAVPASQRCQQQGCKNRWPAG